MISTFADPLPPRARSITPLRKLLGSLALMMLTVPACGLSDYEARMSETQKREERFREEKQYLDEPVKIPTRKDKEGKEIAVANVFFRPPKGIQSSGEEQPNKVFWRYGSRANGGNFWVELAFATDNNTFLDEVTRIYPPNGQQQTTTLPFDRWEYEKGQYTYSVNVSREGGTKVAIVYIFPKGRAGSLRKVMDLSLESLAVDEQAAGALRRYQQKSPWKLENKPGS